MPAVDLLADLTPEQRDAAQHGDGPLLVLAGAGSGKTRVITRRAARLAQLSGMPGVLAITFTNKAAEEMQRRIAALGAERRVLACTFHSFAARTLRMYGERIGLPRNFSIFDTADKRDALKLAVERCDLRHDNWPAAMLDARISGWKNELVSPDELEARAGAFEERVTARIYRAYEQIMSEQQALDFDDLLLRTAKLLGGDEGLRAGLELRYPYVLVDEYQDTNAAQYVIARALTKERRNLCVTGDPDQAIYGWRGANIRNILDFEHDFPDARIVYLERNYRSTGRILEAANRIIADNVHRKPKTLWTENPEGARITVRENETGEEEARAIAEAVADLAAAGRPLGQIAVFYRVNSLSRPIEDALRREHLAYRIARGVEFYNRKEVKDAVAYLRVLANPADEISLLRIINTPARGIGKTSLEKLVAHARRTGITLLDALADSAAAGVGAGAARGIDSFRQLLATMGQLADGPVAEFVAHAIRHSGLEAMYRGEDDKPDESAWGNLGELINSAAEYDRDHPDGSLVDYLSLVSLVSAADVIDGRRDAVTLMTLHAAKGLEFPVVFIAGLEEGFLPHQRSIDNDLLLEEERRLCFVGVTRTQAELTLSWARQRLIRGRYEARSVSRFLRGLRDLDVEWKRTPPRTIGRNGASAGSPPRVLGADEGEFVRHPQYGLGVLLWIQRGVSQTMAGVRFQNGVEKTVVLEHTPLTYVSIEELHSGGQDFA